MGRTFSTSKWFVDSWTTRLLVKFLLIPTPQAAASGIEAIAALTPAHITAILMTPHTGRLGSKLPEPRLRCSKNFSLFRFSTLLPD